MTTSAYAPLPPRLDALTPSEHRLQRLCADSFLTLWSYPGVFKDQGSGEGRAGGKEVCDLLVVFEEHIIVFSDKTCEFPDTGDLLLDWSRWYRKAIVRSAKQLRGAERWIRSHPERLFLDRKCRTPFPYPLPSPETAVFHRILVAGGAGARCQRELGGSGSLMLLSGGPEVPGSAPTPFSVGRVDDHPGFLHVLDDFSLGAVLGTLDTISDFTAYLQAKEKLLASKRFAAAAGEEELLAFYLKNADREGRHAFAIPEKVDGFAIDEGSWESFQTDPQRLAQLEADRVSYAWDALIEKFTHFATTATMEFTNFRDLGDFERSIRLMAREPRVKRRMLAKALFDMMDKPREGKERMTRVILPLQQGDPYYVFLALRRPPNVSLEQYREGRRELLQALCLVTRSKWEDARDIVGIATEPIESEDRSEDLLYMDGREWNDELNEEARELQRQLNLLTNMSISQVSEKEYPDVPGMRHEPARSSHIRFGRNDPCPCRSGRKYKKCCGHPSRRRDVH